MGRTQQKQPPGGHRRHAVNLVDLTKLVKESHRQYNTKTKNPTPQDDDANNMDSAAAMQFDARRTERILTEPIRMVQLNLNRSADVLTVMQQGCLRGADILLYQEPAPSRSNQPQHLLLTLEYRASIRYSPYRFDRRRTQQQTDCRE